MKLHNVIQGSPEWHALRNRIKHTASDLPAIRGNSKFKTRAQAIREAATGIKPEVSDFMQRKFDEGHAAEEQARAIVEQMIGEDLYPSTATTDDEFLLASTDGSTMMGDTGYEHKLWNEEIAAQIRASIESNTCQLHPMYTDQMDQQIAVYGFERIIFVTSDGTLDKLESYEYTGNPESIARIRDDWAQFDIDVANYQPEVVEAKPILTANPLENLPMLAIEITGRVTSSNLAEFRQAATAVIDSIKTELVSDQDFVDATAAVKYLKDVEQNAKLAKTNALSQTASINDLFNALDEVIAKSAEVRIKLDKRITVEKDRRKEAIVIDGATQLREYILECNQRVGGLMPKFDGNFAQVVKGLRTLESMSEKVGVELARCKVEVTTIANRIGDNLKSLEGEGHSWRFLFPDLANVVTKSTEDFANLLASRITAHKAAEEERLEQERARIRAEEQANAQREAAEKITAANQTQFDQREATTSVQTVAQALVNNLHVADPVVIAGIQINQAEVVELPDSGETMKLGDICRLLGFQVTADFLSSLGIEPAKIEKSAKLYTVTKFPTICRLISEHVNNVMRQSLAADFSIQNQKVA